MICLKADEVIQLLHCADANEIAESTFAFVNEVHHLYCQLDELVLSHPHVYKVESVGGCYMVASGIPNVSVTGIYVIDSDF